MKNAGKGGYWYLALIGFALAVLGGIFVVILGLGYLKAKETTEWTVRDGVVIRSQIGERELGPGVPTEYTHELLFDYEVDGEVYQGDRVKRRENPYFKEKKKLQSWVEDWPVGSRVKVFVNPKDPEEAVLDHETKAPGYTIWFPALFLVGGLVIVWRAVGGLLRKVKKTGG